MKHHARSYATSVQLMLEHATHTITMPVEILQSSQRMNMP